MSNYDAINLFGWACLVGGILIALYIFWIFCLETEALLGSDND